MSKQFVYKVHCTMEGTKGVDQVHILASDMHDCIRKFSMEYPDGWGYEIHTVARVCMVDID